METNVDNMKMQKECVDLESELSEFLNKLKEISGQVFSMKDDQGLMVLSDELLAQGKANSMLAFRHLEDAQFRVGKVLECLKGGSNNG